MFFKRKTYNREHLLSICNKTNYGYTLDAQKAVNELARYFLGEHWYIEDPVSRKQANVLIVMEIEEKYRGSKIND